MKKCPFCKADIEDNAKFCLYCMASLNEKKFIKTKSVKNKRWLVILAALLCFAIVVGIVYSSFLEHENPIKDVFVANTTLSQEVTNQKGEVIKDKTFSNGETTNSDNKNTIQEEQPQGKVESESKNKQKTSTSSSKNSQTKKSDSTQNNEIVTTASSTQAQSQSNTSITTKAVVSNVTYVYRAAKRGDDFSVSYQIENCVVITDVTTKSSDGTYIIPEKLDGKRVLAIMGGAFCNKNISSSVKKVVVPSSVKTIWNYAFSSCYNLSDIYFKGSSIYTESNAFANESKRNSTLTIHCSASCSDRNFRYYKNSAGDYGAKYKEWNGGAYN